MLISRALHCYRGSFKFDHRHAPKKSIFLFVTAEKRLCNSPQILVISVSATTFNKRSWRLKKFKKNNLRSEYWPNARLPFLQEHIYTHEFYCFYSTQLNDRTQTVNWSCPGAALSSLNRYTQQHLFLYHWKWDCLWAYECLCTAFFSCIYSM